MSLRFAGTGALLCLDEFADKKFDGRFLGAGLTKGIRSDRLLVECVTKGIAPNEKSLALQVRGTVSPSDS